MAPIDTRLVHMAQVLIRYSLDVRPDNLVAIQGGIEAAPLLREVYRETLQAGGYPELQRLAEDLAQQGSGLDASLNGDEVTGPDVERIAYQDLCHTHQA